MRRDGRWARYVVANRDDGYFQINIIGNKTDARTEKLNICQHCLETLKWQDFSISKMPKSHKQGIVANFLITEFFARYPKSLFSINPTYTSDIAPVNDYSEDWALISEGLKKKRNYKCEEFSCQKIFMGKFIRFLHVHHMDGQKFNNKESNLKVLCLGCHSEEPHHSHMKHTKNYKEFSSIFMLKEA